MARQQKWVGRGRVFQKTSNCAPYRGAAQKLGTLLLLALVAGAGLQAQTTTRTTKVEKARRLVHKVEPAYPQDLRRLRIGGTVKLDLQISAKGNVEKIAVVGGNPILADSASRAVKQWQYEPAEAASSMLLNLEFNPDR